MTRALLLIALVAIVVAIVPPRPAATDSAPPVVVRVGTPAAFSFPTLPPEWTATLTLPPGPSRTPLPTATARPTRTPLGPGAWGPDVIGLSVEGRPIEVYRFGAGPVRRLIIAGIHGGYEWNTIALADDLIAYVSDHPDTLPSNVSLYILRSLNPDGEAHSRTEDGRYNAHRVDINRNFPANWKYDFRRTGCRDQTPGDAGPRPASEPETLALMQWVQAYQPDALISYHSAALGIFAGGQPPTDASLSLAQAVDAVSPYPYPPLNTGCEYTGQLVDWAASLGLAALDVELRTHESTDLDVNLDLLGTFLNWQRP